MKEYVIVKGLRKKECSRLNKNRLVIALFRGSYEQALRFCRSDKVKKIISELDLTGIPYPELKKGNSFKRIPVISQAEFREENRKRKRSQEYLYAVSNEKYIKLGVSCDPENRVESLQTSSPEKLEVIKSWKTDGFASLNMERILNEYFFDLRTCGEWFGPFLDKSKFIQKIDNIISLIKKETEAHKIDPMSRIKKSDRSIIVETIKAKKRSNRY